MKNCSQSLPISKRLRTKAGGKKKRGRKEEHAKLPSNERMENNGVRRLTLVYGREMPERILEENVVVMWR
jgi:hypothetical protein